MKAKEMDNRIEALLFACGEPVSLEKLALCAELKQSEVERSIERLKEAHSSTGIQLMEVGKKHYQFITDPKEVAFVRQLLEEKRDTPLSPAALEVLAIVAYNEPVTRSFVEQIRGVDSSGVMNTLLQKDLLKEAGRMDLPGRPIAYQTTTNFLRCFSLTDLSDLPDIDELVEQFQVDESERQLRLADAKAYPLLGEE